MGPNGWLEKDEWVGPIGHLQKVGGDRANWISTEWRARRLTGGVGPHGRLGTGEGAGPREHVWNVKGWGMMDI